MPEEMALDPPIVTHQLAPDGPFPNHPHWPLVIYKDVIRPESGDYAELMEQVFDANGWGGMWRNGVFSLQPSQPGNPERGESHDQTRYPLNV